MVVVSKLSHDRPRVEAPQNDRPFGRPRGEDVPSAVPVSYRMFIMEIQTSIASAAQRTKSDSFKKKFVTKKERERTKGIYIVPLATRRPPARQPFLDVLERVRIVWVQEQIVHFGVRVFPTKSEEFSPLLRGCIRHADYYE